MATNPDKSQSNTSRQVNQIIDYAQLVSAIEANDIPLEKFGIPIMEDDVKGTKYEKK